MVDAPHDASTADRAATSNQGARQSRTSYADPTASPPHNPRRVLVLSADIGGGHNATADAIEEAVRRRWRGSEIKRLDTLDVMGRGIGRLFRRIYVSNVETTPWLYEFFYASLWRHRWFAHASKRFTGSWAGRRLIGPINEFDPDLIISTYPFGSAGVAWLRRHRALTVPAAAYVSDFAPHPFWAYHELDANFVMHEGAEAVARAAEPGSSAAVCAPPVTAAFHPGEATTARAAIGARPDAFVVVVACGSLAFGDTTETVRAVLDASLEVQVIALCGRNEPTLAVLQDLALPAERLLALGWVEDMPPVYQAADLVITNAGGATALEALATGVPVLMYSPIAAHGIANAELMVVAGLADLVITQQQLTAYVRSVLSHPYRLDDLRLKASVHVETHSLDETLDAIAAPAAHQAATQQPTSRRPWPMRPSDAFFAYAGNSGTDQVLGAVLELDPLPTGQSPTLEEVRRAMAARVSLPPLRRLLVRDPRPGWRRADRVDVAQHIDELVMSAAVSDAEMADAIGEFWSTPLPDDRPAWRMRLFHGQSDGRSVLAVQEHHCQGDGISALGLLDRLLDADPDDPLRERRPARAAGKSGQGGARLLVRGIWSLATRGRPPRHPLNALPTGAGRTLVRVAFPAADLRRVARAHGASSQEAIVGIAADALGRVLRERELVDDTKPLRAMVPIAMRLPKLDRLFGNWTGTVTIDLPIDAMPTGQRIAAVQAQLRDRIRRGEPQGAEAVMRVAGHLGQPVHRLFARTVYNRRFLSTIVSFMPAWPGPRWCAGARVAATYPVVPLTDGVPVTIGAIVADQVTGVALLLDRTLEIAPDSAKRALEAAIADAQRSAG
ncbi:wax ester/triacylglycerol synthase domain-containing protein [Antricoccus suffuscus]|uniref:wax ester/triacylglycerol synthase domain-containing protein n=1 Tax=Antricoccus suffuscus TaxID=1629062 RepID=UPI0014747D9A|nr:wax ester/triacylglycerol synthase domain-containing protein [Antricoccus suffuscus]